MQSHRTLVWAIDLDSGSSIKAMGSDMKRPPAEVFPLDHFTPTANDTDLGSSSPNGES